MKGLIEAIEKENLRTDLPSFQVGDTVKVSVKVIEGSRERIQAFEGVVIAKKHGGVEWALKELFRYVHLKLPI